MKNQRWIHGLLGLVLLGIGGAAAWSQLASATSLATAAVSADPSASATGSEVNEGMIIGVWALAFLASVAALVQARIFYKWMMASDPGTERMIEIAGYVREGANAYLVQQYKVVAAFFVVIVILLSVAAFGLNVQSKFVPFAFLTGGLFSGLSGWCGMKTATWASNRTAAGARKSLNQGLQVAFRSGAVMGLTVVGLGLIDICLWFGFLYWIWPKLGFDPLTLVDITVTMLCFGMGASSQALFARVGGGIFTKAADVGADLVGKVEHGIPEDDPRNPATIADNVGDNVGDVAGMGADLYESYCGAILASAALGVSTFATGGLSTGGLSDLQAQMQTIFLPLALSALGILFSIVGIYCVRTEENASQKTLLKALARGIDLSTLLVIVSAFVLSWFLMPKVPGTLIIFGIPGVAMSIVAGLASGWLIGKWTEYCTSNEYRPTQYLADQALTGPATVIIGGVAEGMMSVWGPVIIVSLGTIAAFGFASGWQFADPNYFALGLYGVGIAAVGMLSTLGITLATDAYGPIADNAGGNAQMSELEPLVRERTDALDCLGNTTAATGKGFAIGSAALTALALMAAYVEEVRIGFERWGEAVGETAAPGLYKVSPGFVVYRKAPEEIKNEREAKVHTYLALPYIRGDDRVAEAWNKITFRKEPGKIPSDMFTRTEQTKGPPQIVLSAGGERIGALVPVHTAALADFMTYYDATLMNPKVLVGIFLGTMLVFVFSAMTMKAVGRAAKGMVEEVRRQFRENKGIMAGTSKPDYAAPVAISTKAAQAEMVLPSLLGLASPVVVGLLLGVAGVLGLLMGGLTTGFAVAVFMANAGGAWDNAKKHIESGVHGGKGTDAHKAAVVGDTVGDPFKDTSGPSLNILIKLMSMVSVVAAGVVVRYSLAALGIF